MIRQIAWTPITDPFVGHAIIARPPSFFEKERGIHFTDSEDDLGSYRGALFMKDGLTPVVLKRYQHQDENWTVVYLSHHVHDLDYIDRTIAEFVADLELSSADLIWRRKDNPDA